MPISHIQLKKLKRRCKANKTDRTRRNRMDPHDTIEPEQLDALSRAFSEQLLACLEECARGRKGLFSDFAAMQGDADDWPEAGRLRELALALQGIFAQQGQ